MALINPKISFQINTTDECPFENKQLKYIEFNIIIISLSTQFRNTYIFRFVLLQKSFLCVK